MRSAHDAVKAGQEFVAAGKKWVVDIDLKSFFDQVNHDRLMSMIGRKVKDKRVLSLIGRYLRAEMQRGDGSREARKAGTPQGGPLSPLLANIYLDPLDKELEKRGVSFVRYADDTGTGSRIRGIVWSCYGDAHKINLCESLSCLDATMARAAVAAMQARATLGGDCEGILRRVLERSGEFARWDAEEKRTPAGSPVVYPPIGKRGGV